MPQFILRKLARQEGISSWEFLWRSNQRSFTTQKVSYKDDVVVVLLHDSGSRYIGKIYNDEWMKEKGFI